MTTNKSRIIIALLILLLIASFLWVYSLNPYKEKNVVDSELISRGQGWQGNESRYSGSEAQLLFKNSSKISFGFDSSTSAYQQVRIFVDQKEYVVTSPNLGNQLLTVFVDKNKQHTVTLQYVCIHELHPCKIKLTKILVENDSSLLPYSPEKKTISILGDSISAIYGYENYSFQLGRDLGHRLHNASIFGSTVSRVKGWDNAINRYSKDLKKYKSDILIIFIGTNDAGEGVPISMFENDYSMIVKNVKKWRPETKMFLVGILPRKDVDTSIIGSYNSVIKTVADQNGVKYIDTSNWIEASDFLDDIHPSRESQSKIAENMRKAISSDID